MVKPPHRKAAPVRWLLAVLLVALVASPGLGCSQKHQTETAESAAVEPSEKTLGHLPLSDHIPSMGLRWLVHLKPKSLLARESFRNDWSQLFAPDRIQAFSLSSGVQLEEVDDVWIAGYDLGVLYVVDARSTGASMEEAFRRRALSTSEKPNSYANVTHLTGMMDNAPSALLHIHEHLIAIADGDIQLTKIVLAYAEGRLNAVPSVFEHRHLTSLRPLGHGAQASAFLLGPFESATDSVSAALVSGVLVAQHEEGKLNLRARAIGVWPPSEQLSDNLQMWLDQLLSTREFRALGFGFPIVSPKVACGDDEDSKQYIACESSGTWDAPELAKAIRRITSGSISEIVSEASTTWKHEATPSARERNAEGPSPENPSEKPSGPVE